MKKILVFAMLSMGVLSVSAQNLLGGTHLWDNWSVGINAGGVTPLKHSAFFKNMRPAMGLELGKQLTPYLGMTLEGMTYVNTTQSKNVFDNTNLSLLGRVNLNNLFWGYNGTPRTFEVEAVAGLGWLRYYQNGGADINNLSSKLGLNFNFNLGESKAWTLAIKPALVYDLDADENRHSVRYNANFAAVELTAGLVYHFKGSNGKRHFTYERAYNQAEIDGLNAKVNDLRAKNNEAEAALNAANRKADALQRELDACRNQKPTVQTVTVTETAQTLESVVTFRQGKSVIDASQQPNVERVATYLKNHPEAKVVIKGYASPEGSLEVNQKIALARAEAVKAALVGKYKIAASRIQAEGQGVGNMFEEPDWNRVSICTIEK